MATTLIAKLHNEQPQTVATATSPKEALNLWKALTDGPEGLIGAITYFDLNKGRLDVMDVSAYSTEDYRILDGGVSIPNKEVLAGFLNANRDELDANTNEALTKTIEWMNSDATILAGQALKDIEEEVSSAILYLDTDYLIDKYITSSSFIVAMHNFAALLRSCVLNKTSLFMTASKELNLLYPSSVDTVSFITSDEIVNRPPELCIVKGVRIEVLARVETKHYTLLVVNPHPVFGGAANLNEICFDDEDQVVLFDNEEDLLSSKTLARDNFFMVETCVSMADASPKVETLQSVYSLTHPNLDSDDTNKVTKEPPTLIENEEPCFPKPARNRDVPLSKGRFKD